MLVTYSVCQSSDLAESGMILAHILFLYWTRILLCMVARQIKLFWQLKLQVCYCLFLCLRSLQTCLQSLLMATQPACNRKVVIACFQALARNMWTSLTCIVLRYSLQMLRTRTNGLICHFHPLLLITKLVFCHITRTPISATLIFSH